jgi:hypothetical protein
MNTLRSYLALALAIASVALTGQAVAVLTRAFRPNTCAQVTQAG